LCLQTKQRGMVITIMRKRIYKNFLWLILLSALLLSAVLSAVVYVSLRNREMSAVRDRAILAADILNGAVNAEGFTDFLNLDADVARITITAPDGTVLIDNKADAATLENHGDREEIKQALYSGRGDAMRYSVTLGGETYYYAILLDDGNVLRIAKPMERIAEVFIGVLRTIVIVTLIVLILANVVAHRLTKNIVAPLNNIDFDGDNSGIYDEFSPFVRKIEQQKSEIEKQMLTLKSRADTIETITENMKEGLILIDTSGIMLSVNKSAVDIFREKDLVGQNILHICREMEFQAGVKQCLSGTDSEVVFMRGGKIYSVYLSSVYGGGELNGGVIFFLDVSEKHEAEKQRREFSANVSHELKTPLTTILALTEMIENGMAKEADIKAFAGKILVQARRLINIIEDIIKLSEFDEGKSITERVSFDVFELAQSVADALHQSADEKKIRISITGEQFHITANRQMIDELLYNLLDNAIKYNKDNGSVTVALSEENEYCKIAVTDTGIGILPENQSRVFERFYRIDKSRSNKTGGTGLGLSIVKHIVEHHGGKVELTSTPGVGTTVECYIREQDAEFAAPHSS